MNTVFHRRVARDLSLNLEVARGQIICHGKRGFEWDLSPTVCKFEIRVQGHADGVLRECIGFPADELLEFVKIEYAMLHQWRLALARGGKHT